MLTLFYSYSSTECFSAKQNFINKNGEAGIGGDYNAGLFKISKTHNVDQRMISQISNESGLTIHFHIQTNKTTCQKNIGAFYENFDKALYF